MSNLNDILDEWPYDPTECVRKVTVSDGREVMQVRTPLGIEQYELTGRPDGTRPNGRESVLHEVEEHLTAHIERFGVPEGFEIGESTALELQQEGILYYYRYLVCFQVGEYEVVVRDTHRNLRMFDLLKSFCTEPDIVMEAEQYRPYVLRIGGAARALMATAASDFTLARSIISRTIKAIEELPDVPTSTFEQERRRSLAVLKGMRKALPTARRANRADALRGELDKAVAEENYERAAVLRDELRALGARNGTVEGRGTRVRSDESDMSDVSDESDRAGQGAGECA